MRRLSTSVAIGHGRRKQLVRGGVGLVYCVVVLRPEQLLGRYELGAQHIDPLVVAGGAAPGDVDFAAADGLAVLVSGDGDVADLVRLAVP